jgi:hypothetical protein
LFGKKKTDLDALNWRAHPELRKLQERRDHLVAIIPGLDEATEAAQRASEEFGYRADTLEALKAAGRMIAEDDLSTARKRASETRQDFLVKAEDGADAKRELEKVERAIPPLAAALEAKAIELARELHQAALADVGVKRVAAAEANHHLLAVHDAIAAVWPGASFGDVAANIYDHRLGIERYLADTSLLLPDPASINGTRETALGRWLQYVNDEYRVHEPLDAAAKLGAASKPERDESADRMNPKFVLESAEA